LLADRFVEFQVVEQVSDETVRRVLKKTISSRGREKNGAFPGKFHGPRKVDNSFLRRASAHRHCPLWSSLYLRPWFTRLSHSVRSFPTVNRATSFPSLFWSGFRSALCLRACLAQIADDYAHPRTVPEEHSMILTLLVVAVDNARIPDRRCRYTSRSEALTSDCC
jgi:hypothetical protein